MAVPREHIETICDLSNEQASTIFKATVKIARGVRDVSKCDGMNLVQSNVEAGLQDVFHLYFHIVPPSFGDNIVLDWDNTPALQEHCTGNKDLVGEVTMTTFYLVRHAHSDWTLDENRPLSGQGGKDAIRMADTLAEYPVDIIYSSPATRAYQTIAPFAERLGLPIQDGPDLRERVLGEEKFEDFFGAVEATWRDPFFAHPGGETSAEAQKRGLAIVKRLQAKHPNKAILLSTHGNLMALVLQGFDPAVDFYFWKSMTMPDIYLLKTGSRNPTIQRIWQP